MAKERAQGPWEVEDARARLIDTADELLAELKNVTALLRDYINSAGEVDDHDRAVLLRADAAIAKAEVGSVTPAILKAKAS